MRMVRVGMTTLIVCMSLVVGAAQAKSSKVTLDAFSVWQGNSKIVQVGPKHAVIVGVLGGLLFVEAEGGPVAVGTVACPGAIYVDMNTGIESGTGHCTVTATDGALVFGDWTCDGALASGCMGDYTITGGTGRLATIRGKSDILFESYQHDFDNIDATTANIIPSGITIWPSMSVSLREQLSGK